jgi:hypothetical protein
MTFAQANRLHHAALPQELRRWFHNFVAQSPTRPRSA